MSTLSLVNAAASSAEPIPAGEVWTDTAVKLWHDVLEAYELAPMEVRLLVEVCRTTSTLDRVTEELNAVDSLVVRGSTGQPSSHPLIATAVALRNVLSRLTRDLGIQDLTIGADERIAAQARSSNARSSGPSLLP